MCSQLAGAVLWGQGPRTTHNQGILWGDLGGVTLEGRKRIKYISNIALDVSYAGVWALSLPLYLGFGEETDPRNRTGAVFRSLGRMVT